MEPKEGEIRGSLVGPLIKRLEEEKLDAKLLERMREIAEEAAIAAIESFLDGFDFTTEIYEIVNNLINNLTNNRYLTQVHKVRKAYCKAAAGAATTIVCYLDTDTLGDEVTVNCSIAGGGNLNAAIPRLADGTLIFVAKIGGDWHCTTTFQASEDCDCYTAP